MKKNIAIMFGGASSEHDVSKKSAYTVKNAVDTDKYNIFCIGIDRDGKWYLCQNQDDEKRALILDTDITVTVCPGSRVFSFSNGKDAEIDAAFPVLHGKNGEDGTIQGLFELLGIPYIGCGVLASAASMDKSATKLFVNSIGIRQAKYVFVQKGDAIKNFEEDIKKLSLPLFIKASRSGSSNGVFKVTDYADAEKYINMAMEYDSKVLIEEGIIGREIECAVMQKGDEYIASVPGEILSAEDFYTFDSKYNNAQSKTVVNPVLPEGVADKIRDCAKRIFKVLDCHDLSRVDFFVEDKTNDVVFNEINTLPGFTSISMYPMLMDTEGFDIKSLVNGFIERCIAK